MHECLYAFVGGLVSSIGPFCLLILAALNSGWPVASGIALLDNITPSGTIKPVNTFLIPPPSLSLALRLEPASYGFEQYHS